VGQAGRLVKLHPVGGAVGEGRHDPYPVQVEQRARHGDEGLQAGIFGLFVCLLFCLYFQHCFCSLSWVRTIFSAWNTPQ
jgi:hypothetical protein